MTTPGPSVDLRPDHWAIVRDALRRHVPDREVLAFGSRATWTAKEYSDLDLAVMGEEPLSLRTAAALDEALGESDLPFKVDVVDWARIDDGFRSIIRRHGVAIQSAAGSSKEKSAKYPSVPSAEGWREARLGEVVRFLSGGTPSKKCAAYWNGEIPWVSAKEMKQFRLRDTTTKVTVEALANGAKRVPAGTVLLLTRGMRLLKEVPVCVIQQPMTFNQDIKALEANADINPSFLPYLLLANTERLRNLVDLAGHGTGRINTDELGALSVRLPPTREQRAIAHILGTLDDKIELNRRMNETLEAMMRALFKSWFIDFDPVRAKIEGRDTGLPRDIADLFPDRLVDSEMGEMPEGWEVMPLGDLVELAYGKPLPKRKRRPGPVPVYGSNGQVDWHDQKLVDGPGVVVGRKGNPGLVSWSPTGFFPIDTTFYVVSKDAGLGMLFLFHLLRTQDLPSIASDSAVPGMNRNLAYMNRAIVPSKAVVGMFAGSVKAISVRQYGLKQESRALVALRDTLLPELVSGDVRLRDAESFGPDISFNTTRVPG